MIRFVLISVICLVIFGCKTTIESSDLEGKWYLISVTNINTKENVKLLDCSSYEFMSSGKVEGLNPNKTVGEWKLKANELTVTMVSLDGRNLKRVFLVKSLDPSELILEAQHAKLHYSRECINH